MKCLIIPRRHTIYSLLLPALFFLSLFSFSLLKSSSASAASLCSFNYDISSASSYNDKILISRYNDLYFSDFCDFSSDPVYLSIIPHFGGYYPNLIQYYSYIYHCSSYSDYSLSNCSSYLSYNLGDLYFSLNSFWSNFGLLFKTPQSTYGYSGYITFTFYDTSPFDTPSGSLSITENGTYDVSSYAEAVVEVPNTETIVEGDYHDDLVGLKNAILIAIAVVIVFCFFKIILNMIMGVRR